MNGPQWIAKVRSIDKMQHVAFASPVGMTRRKKSYINKPSSSCTWYLRTKLTRCL